MSVPIGATALPAASRTASPPDGDGHHQLRVLAAVASHELPVDLRAAASTAGAPRQVVRFLDGMALPAFVAGVTALDVAGVEDGEHCGIFTVSNWDPDPAPPDLGDEPPSYAAVARHYITTASPMSWLRKMVNNALCQVAMVRGLRGANNHVVGDCDALAAILTIGARVLERGVARHVLVVAYDALLGYESDHEVEGRACAVVLDVTGAASQPLAPAFASIAHSPSDILRLGRQRGGRAVDALDALIEQLRGGEASDGG